MVISSIYLKNIFILQLLGGRVYVYLYMYPAELAENLMEYRYFWQAENNVVVLYVSK